MLTPVQSMHRARRIYRLHARLPRRLRRPRPALRAAAMTGALWFAVLFAALGLGGAGPRTASAAFLVAAGAGVASSVLVATSRYERAMWCAGAMLVTGQIAALTAAW